MQALMKHLADLSCMPSTNYLCRHIVCWASETWPAIRACLLDNVTKMLRTLSARVDSGQHIHLRAAAASDSCPSKLHALLGNSLLPASSHPFAAAL